MSEISSLAQAKANERAQRETLRAMIEAIIATYPGQEDKARAAFKHALDGIAAADARDDAMAAGVLADVDVG